MRPTLSGHAPLTSDPSDPKPNPTNLHTHAYMIPLSLACFPPTHPRLLAAYLLRLASPTAALGAPPRLPLPDPAPMEFVQLPVRGVWGWVGGLGEWGWGET